ncbi:hypothetical protein DFH09DRAFT_382398 [Mycena vulgaris]|nr:hypothetical protein DFH09DRAFT_382398 [Mycena vulgaris]
MVTRPNPLEITDLAEYCVDFLDSVADLRAAALVHRSWTYAAQAHIFSKIDLTNPPQNHRRGRWASLNHACTRLLDALAVSPHLVNFVLFLSIDLHLLLEITLKRISQHRFPRLYELQLTGYEGSSTGVSAPLQQLLSLHSLKRLHIAGNLGPAVFPLIWRHCSQSIEHLTLDRIWMSKTSVAASDDNLDLGPDRRRITLKTLHVVFPKDDTARTIEGWLQGDDGCPFDFSKLKMADLDLNTNLLEWNTFAPGFATMDVLMIRVRRSMLPLTSFEALVHLEILIEDFPAGLQTVASISQRNQIKTLLISMSMWITSATFADICAQLDRTVSALSLPHLQRVQINLSGGEPQILENRFPILAATGLLTFRFEPTRGAPPGVF